MVSESKEARSAKDTRRTSASRPRPASTTNPRWYAPLMVTLMVLGLAYLVATYVLSASGYAQYPLNIGNWNLAVGGGVMLVGFGMLLNWK
ncbi:cell division protein CrgA [Micrococcales bacterium 31B]|nr:cell division protein CrgA [Micrococcales bacterium 31B]